MPVRIQVLTGSFQ